MLPALNEPLTLDQAARVPSPGDNAAVAVRTLPAGARVLIRQLAVGLAHTVLEGHRFAIHRIAKGGLLLSWGLPFGRAARDIEPGEYLCNQKVLRSLAERSVSLSLPRAPNFVDHGPDFRLDEAGFQPGIQVTTPGPAPVFSGFRRAGGRGCGTRNYIVVLGTSARTAPFARALAARFQDAPARFPNVDGVVAVGHTEGGGSARAENFEFTVRTLAGFMVNPNVAAVLCVDFGNEAVCNAALRACLTDGRYPVEDLPHAFYSINGSFEQALEEAGRIVAAWLPAASGLRRESLSVRHLALALQCGGSDAFSGLSANPLAGLLSRDTVAFGGRANLAETDELIGAESYILQNVRDLETARAFLRTLDRFQQWAGVHGHSAEGNPSGGNLFRGLYNITIKSIGAARKKDPATRLDGVLDYAARMRDPGFFFMNSPGNDLESIAGQVASGCNLILFATGNGSITNFPFVPAIKIMTTTRRFELVRNEMDFNAGRYLDGEPLEDLGREAFAQMLRIASGERSAGERAGHSQVQLWREWRGGAGPSGAAARGAGTKRELPVSVVRGAAALKPSTPERVAVVLPTSLCSGQVARLIAEKLNALPGKRFSRAVALPHTEGCGNSAGESEQLFLRTMAGYLAHPMTARGVLLEHGCEKTHNDAFHHTLRALGIDASRFGFASIQLDGGIERVTGKVLAQFLDGEPLPDIPVPFSLGAVALDPCPEEAEVIRLLAEACRSEGAAFVGTASAGLDGERIEYGARFPKPGVYSMQTPTGDLAEIITGLAATGAQMILVFASDQLAPGNPLAPTLQAACEERMPAGLLANVDVCWRAGEPASVIAGRLLTRIGEVRAGTAAPKSQACNNTSFQVTRGYTGISL